MSLLFTIFVVFFDNEADKKSALAVLAAGRSSRTIFDIDAWSVRL